MKHQKARSPAPVHPFSAQVFGPCAARLTRGVRIGVALQGKILTAETTSMLRPVQHHYDDRRAASEGGTCFKYKLFHKTTSGVRCDPMSQASVVAGLSLAP